MLLTIGGPPGSGTSTLANMLKDKLNLHYEYAGAVFRKMAKEKKMSLEEFGEYATAHPEIDRELDDKMITIAKTPGNHLLEGRMVGALVSRKNIPSVKIWVDASLDIRAKRLMVRDHFAYDEAIQKMTRRDECDKKRYLDLYSIDPATDNCYDLKLMSDNLLPEQLAEIIISFVNKNFKEKKMTVETSPVMSMDELAVKVGGMFALVTLINMRTREIKKGARPLVNESLKNIKDLVLREIQEGKISLKATDASDFELVYEEDDDFFLEN